jgi:hypothetical protein
MRSMDLWTLAVISSVLFLFLSHIQPSPKDTHKKVFGSHLGVMMYPLDNPSKVFPKPCRCNFLCASNSIVHTTFKRHKPSTSTID